MTAREFAHLVNTPYPTVAQWLRDGRVPGAEMQEIGNLKVWLIPKDVLKDFKRPEMGRPKRASRADGNQVEQAATSGANEPAPTKPKRRATRKAGLKRTMKSAKRGGAAK